eukprot:3167792-Prymnesium_polylepis.1
MRELKRMSIPLEVDRNVAPDTSVSASGSRRASTSGSRPPRTARCAAATRARTAAPRNPNTRALTPESEPSACWPF